jgi:UDP-galactopyranose mutase
MVDYLIVGAGFAGCVLAEQLAAKGNKQILLVEKRRHIGGNAYDEYNDQGILIHKYGPHIFHSNTKAVWDYLSHFTKWHYYQHKVLAYADGQLVPFPVNLDTINLLYGTSYDTETLHAYLLALRAGRTKLEIYDSRDMAVSRVGQVLYEKFFRNYTKKQWDLWPEELAPEVTARIPLRENRDGRYFADQYQGLPAQGYTRMFEKMLAHDSIHLLLNTDYRDVVGQIAYKQLIYTGPIDAFFDDKYGKLPYRSIDFEFETLLEEHYQAAATINYPNDYDFTRITEYKQLTGQQHPYTTIVREYPTAEGEPYYPIPQAANQLLYNRYLQDAQQTNTIFVGRLAEYRYYNMDVVVEKALKVANSIAENR